MQNIWDGGTNGKDILHLFQRGKSEHLAVVQTTFTKSLHCDSDKGLKMSSDNV